MIYGRYPVAAALICSLTWSPLQAAGPSPEDRAAVHTIAREVEIARILEAQSERAIRGPVIFRDVSIVDVVHNSVKPHQSVVTQGGRISWVGDAARVPSTKGATMVVGSGLFLSPGLTDMHVHTQSLSEQVLRLATGVTSVRDMDGFPWLLRLRRAIRGGHLLAPTHYIAGTIIADYPLSGYAVVVNTAEEARHVVRNQAACGYDFIKVHNRLAEPLFDAVADQARRSGKDLIGHIPHDITIDHAVHVGSMRTLEHLKGFINDGSFRASPEDFALALKGAQVWITPTFYVVGRHLHDEGAMRELARPEMQYVSSTLRAQWSKPDNMQIAPDWHDRLAELLSPGLVDSLPLYSPLILEKRLDRTVPIVMARLLPLHLHWLAGTDSAQYNFQIPGFALLDELSLMESHGIARADVLRAATSEPAAAMRRSDEFGQIRAGLRADLVLLSSNPTTSLAAFRSNLGVMVNGVWLDRANLDAALKALAHIEGELDASFVLDKASASALVAAVLHMSGTDVTLDPRLLQPAADAMRHQGFASVATDLMAANSDAAPDPCREFLPADD